MDEHKTGYENLTNLELRLEDGEDLDVRREVVSRGYDFKSFFNRRGWLHQAPSTEGAWMEV